MASLATQTIAQVLPALESGGVESHCLEIASACAQAGLRSIVISEGGDMVALLKKRGVEHLKFPLRSKNPFSAWQRAHRLADLLQKNQVNIAHYRSRVPGWLCIWARNILRKRGYTLHLVSSYHGFYKAQGWGKKQYNKIMIAADHVVITSHCLRAHVEREYGPLPDQHTTVITEGVDFAQYPLSAPENRAQMREELGLPQAGLMLLQVGRLSQLKGTAFIARLLAKFPDQNWVWVLAGNANAYPEEKARIMKVLNAHDLAERVHYLGVRRDLNRVYPAADILISGSQQPEAFGRTVIEAAACAVPAFVPNQGGTAEVVINHQTGWHYPMGDLEGAEQCLKNILMLPPEALIKYGLHAQEHTRTHYRLEETCRKTLGIYDSFLSAH